MDLHEMAEEHKKQSVNQMTNKSFWDKTIPEIENRYARLATVLILMPLFIVAGLSLALVDLIINLADVVYMGWTGK